MERGSVTHPCLESRTTQASLVVAGLLGILVFRELKDCAAIAVFFTSSAIVVAGAVVLGVYGPSPSA